MNDRNATVFDVAHVTPHGTHVEAYVRASNGWYTLFVCPYTLESGTLAGIRRYPLSATVAHRIEACPRFSARRLATLATDPGVLVKARNLAGM